MDHFSSKQPYIIINMAMSVDGKVSSILREATTFTSPEDKRYLLKIRSRSDALIVGAHTAALDYTSMGISDPRLRAKRQKNNQSMHPLRVIVSGRLSLLPSLTIFKASISPILIVCCETAPHQHRAKFTQLGRVFICGKKNIDVNKLISFLAKEYGVRTILCEGGPTLNEAFFKAGRVNELYLTLSPYIVGGQNAPTLSEGQGIAYLKKAVRSRLLSKRRGRQEWFLRYRFVSS